MIIVVIFARFHSCLLFFFLFRRWAFNRTHFKCAQYTHCALAYTNVNTQIINNPINTQFERVTFSNFILWMKSLCFSMLCLGSLSIVFILCCCFFLFLFFDVWVYLIFSFTHWNDLQNKQIQLAAYGRFMTSLLLFCFLFSLPFYIRMYTL